MLMKELKCFTVRIAEFILKVNLEYIHLQDKNKNIIIIKRQDRYDVGDYIIYKKNDKQVVEQIKKSSVVLFLSSQSSNQSSNVIKEIGISVHYQKPIIPIKLDTYSYDVNIEYDLSNIDYLEYNSDKSFTIKLIDSIRVHL